MMFSGTLSKVMPAKPSDVVISHYAIIAAREGIQLDETDAKLPFKETAKFGVKSGIIDQAASIIMNAEETQTGAGSVAPQSKLKASSKYKKS